MTSFYGAAVCRREITNLLLEKIYLGFSGRNSLLIFLGVKNDLRKHYIS